MGGGRPAECIGGDAEGDGVVLQQLDLLQLRCSVPIEQARSRGYLGGTLHLPFGKRSRNYYDIAGDVLYHAKGKRHKAVGVPVCL